MYLYQVDPKLSPTLLGRYSQALWTGPLAVHAVPHVSVEEDAVTTCRSHDKARLVHALRLRRVVEAELATPPFLPEAGLAVVHEKFATNLKERMSKT